VESIHAPDLRIRFCFDELYLCNRTFDHKLQPRPRKPKNLHIGFAIGGHRKELEFQTSEYLGHQMTL
jgi:hypothetical protein